MSCMKFCTKTCLLRMRELRRGPSHTAAVSQCLPCWPPCSACICELRIHHRALGPSCPRTRMPQAPPASAPPALGPACPGPLLPQPLLPWDPHAPGPSCPSPSCPNPSCPGP